MRIGLLWGSVVLLSGPGSALAQSITTQPGTVAIPVGGGVFSILVGCMMIAAALWMLRRRGFTGGRLLYALLPITLVSGLVGHSIGPSIAATLADFVPRQQEVFTNPNGEIKNIPILPVTLSLEELCENPWEPNELFFFDDEEGPFEGIFTYEEICLNGEENEFPEERFFVGLRDVEFTNTSNAPLRVSSIDLPSLEQCSAQIDPTWQGEWSEEDPLAFGQFIIWLSVFTDRLANLFSDLIGPVQQGMQAQNEPETIHFEEIEEFLDEDFLQSFALIPSFCAPGKLLAPDGRCVVPVSLTCFYKVVVGCSLGLASEEEDDFNVVLGPNSTQFCSRTPLSEGFFPGLPI